jgi:hypothetical protein
MFEPTELLGFAGSFRQPDLETNRTLEDVAIGERRGFRHVDEVAPRIRSLAQNVFKGRPGHKSVEPPEMHLVDSCVDRLVGDIVSQIDD